MVFDCADVLLKPSVHYVLVKDKIFVYDKPHKVPLFFTIVLERFVLNFDFIRPFYKDFASLRVFDDIFLVGWVAFINADKLLIDFNIIVGLFGIVDGGDFVLTDLLFQLGVLGWV